MRISDSGHMVIRSRHDTVCVNQSVFSFVYHIVYVFACVRVCWFVVPDILVSRTCVYYRQYEGSLILVIIVCEEV